MSLHLGPRLGFDFGRITMGMTEKGTEPIADKPNKGKQQAQHNQMSQPRKRPFNELNNTEEDEYNENIAGVGNNDDDDDDNDEDEDDLNTTRSFYSSLLCLYATSRGIAGIHFDATNGLLELIENFAIADDTSMVLQNMTRRYQPDVLVCNGRIKMFLQSDNTQNSDTTNSDEKVNDHWNNLIIDVKSSKEFSSLEGKQFLISLRQELTDFGGPHEEKATILSEIMECEEKNLYVSYRPDISSQMVDPQSSFCF
ncbi:unnamed protein product [Ambrosiozyma monospora]|uniref:Unnamed protein product n=1 Tax=Ambrosiozyma monospora TaxID=43982 RepID=A0A9W6SX84_AMBMO|nr:unnamed protein product [Ambrosiozyma monospora]